MGATEMLIHERFVADLTWEDAMYPDDLEYDLDAPGADWNYEPPKAKVFNQASVALYTTDAEGWLTYYNDAAAALWGYRPVLGHARWFGSWRIYRPDGSLLPHGQCPMAVTLKEGRALQGVRLVLERPDRTMIRFMPCPMLLRSRSGALVAASNVLLELAPWAARYFQGRSERERSYNAPDGRSRRCA